MRGVPRPYRPRIRRERMEAMSIEATEHVDTVSRGGQGGLATGYDLKRLGHDPLILDAHERVGRASAGRSGTRCACSPIVGAAGDADPRPWLVVPHQGRDGRGPGGVSRRGSNLQVRPGVTVDRLTREGDRFVLRAGGSRLEARNVRRGDGSPSVSPGPTFASELPILRSTDALQPSTSGRRSSGPAALSSWARATRGPTSRGGRPRALDVALRQ